MDCEAPASEIPAAGRAWLDSLPGAGVNEAEAALAALPRDAVSAGEDLPQVIGAWISADPAMAARLLEEWLATVGESAGWRPCFPVVCQWAERIAEKLPEADAFVERNLPGLARCIEGEFDRYDPKGTGLPHWPSPEEALFPEEQAEGVFTADLAVLLSNEARAFCRLARDRETEWGRVLDHVEGEQHELDTWLGQLFWDEADGVFLRLEEGGGRGLDDSPCGAVPLVWGGLSPDMADGLHAREDQWDPSAWPVRARELLLALLLSTPHGRMTARVVSAPWPGDLPAAPAAVRTVLAATVRTATAGKFPAAVHWLEAHGKGLARAGWGAAVLLMVSLLAWGVFQRESVGPDDIEGLERRAFQASAEGRHDRAAALYGQAARRGHGAYYRYRQAGEWMRLGFHEEAEKVYRLLLEEEPGAPNPRWNLAVAVMKQGRRGEALALYRDLAEGPEAAAYPALAARARRAVELIERQMELDGGD